MGRVSITFVVHNAGYCTSKLAHLKSFLSNIKAYRNKAGVIFRGFAGGGALLLEVLFIFGGLSPPKILVLALFFKVC